MWSSCAWVMMIAEQVRRAAPRGSARPARSDRCRADRRPRSSRRSRPGSICAGCGAEAVELAFMPISPTPPSGTKTRFVCRHLPSIRPLLAASCRPDGMPRLSCMGGVIACWEEHVARLDATMTVALVQHEPAVRVELPEKSAPLAVRLPHDNGLADACRTCRAIPAANGGKALRRRSSAQRLGHSRGERCKDRVRL